MKCFVTNSTPDAHGFIKPGIPVNINPNPYIPIGEEGRQQGCTRLITRVPVTLVLATCNPITTDPNLGSVTIIEEARVRKLPGTGQIIISQFQEDFSDPRALVHLKYPGGFKGNVSWETLSTAGIFVPFFDYELSRNPHRITWPLALSGGVTLLAYGYRATGLAGKESGPYDEFLAFLHPGALIKIKRGGAIYDEKSPEEHGGHRELFFMWDGHDLGVMTAEDRADRLARSVLEKNPEQFKDL